MKGNTEMELTQLHGGRRKAEKPRTDDQTVTGLLETMDELADVLAIENDFLDRGLPAALSEVAARKSELADEYRDACEEVLSSHRDELQSRPELMERLASAGTELHCLTHENMARLEVALAATQRRIDAVMAAVQASGDSEMGKVEHFIDLGIHFRA